MPVAIDTSVLISAEKQGSFEQLLPENEEGPYYIPALAASEFLVGCQPPVRSDLRHRALRLYQSRFRSLVSSFTESSSPPLKQARRNHGRVTMVISMMQIPSS